MSMLMSRGIVRLFIQKKADPLRDPPCLSEHGFRLFEYGGVDQEIAVHAALDPGDLAAG